MKLKKFTIPLGLTAVHGHNNPQDWGPAGWPKRRHHQHDSSSRHGPIASAASARGWLGIDIVPRPSRLGNAIASWTRQQHCATTNMVRPRHHLHRLEGMTHTSPPSNSTRRVTVDQTRRLEEYHSNWQPNSDTLLPTLLPSTRASASSAQCCGTLCQTS
jgi:hypothetical protein